MSNFETAEAGDVQYQRAHVNESRVSNLIVSAAICLPLAFLAVILRVVARRLGKIPFKADDWCIVVALVSHLFAMCDDAFTACVLSATYLGLGRHQVLVRDSTAFAKNIIAKEVVYNPAIIAIKTSILLLYKRIFTQRLLNKPFETCLWLTGAFVLAYSLVQAIITVFHCTPVRAIWDPSIDGTCIDFNAALITLSCLNIGTDVVILCLPLPQLWKLQISRKQKLQVMGMFLLGGFICVVSVVRVPAIARLSMVDATWSDTYAAIWSVVELNVGIVSACLPTLGPLFFSLFESKRSPYTRSSSAGSHSAGRRATRGCLEKPRLEGGSDEWALTDDEHTLTPPEMSMRIKGGWDAGLEKECKGRTFVVTELEQRSA